MPELTPRTRAQAIWIFEVYFVIGEIIDGVEQEDIDF